MKFTKDSMCKECPFRINAPAGWLGPDTAMEVIQHVHHEECYPCHMSITITETGSVDNSQVEHCAGAMLHANKSVKRFRDPEALAMQDRLKDNTTPVLGYREFIEHHSNGPMSKRKT